MTNKLHTIYKNKAGERLPGCTTIIDECGWNKRALMMWTRKEMQAGRDPDKVRDQAARKGTLAHYMIECHIKGVPQDSTILDQYSKDEIGAAENSYLAFLDWDKGAGIVFKESELQLVSEEWQYGCTIDCVAEDANGLVIIDFKTGRGIYDEYKLQLAANTEAYDECRGGNNIKGWFSLVVNRDNGSFLYKKYSVEEIYLGWQAFQHCLGLYNIRKEFAKC